MTNPLEVCIFGATPSYPTPHPMQVIKGRKLANVLGYEWRTVKLRATVARQ